jgi:mono/diheme cytochrome c family protein
VGALQLSSDRDPLAPHGEARRPDDADLRGLIARGWLRNLPTALVDQPPRIYAPSPVARAALGYLHANCGHCHNDNGSPPPVDLVLAQSTAASEASYAKVMRSLVGAASRYRAPGMAASASIVDAGRPDGSVLIARLRSRDPRIQMPPLGTDLADPHALALVERWIHELPPTRKEPHP